MFHLDVFQCFIIVAFDQANFPLCKFPYNFCCYFQLPGFSINLMELPDFEMIPDSGKYEFYKVDFSNEIQLKFHWVGGTENMMQFS